MNGFGITLVSWQYLYYTYITTVESLLFCQTKLTSLRHLTDIWFKASFHYTKLYKCTVLICSSIFTFVCCLRFGHKTILLIKHHCFDGVTYYVMPEDDNYLANMSQAGSIYNIHAEAYTKGQRRVLPVMGASPVVPGQFKGLTMPLAHTSFKAAAGFCSLWNSKPLQCYIHVQSFGWLTLVLKQVGTYV